MGHRLSKIYTRTGDDGTTGLGDGARVQKDSLRIAAIGDVDELNCAIGVVLGHEIPDEIKNHLIDVQHKLFNLGGELCIPGYSMITDENTLALEQYLDQLNADLPMLKEFILPGGGQAASFCHMARAVCRRAERSVISLAKQEPVNEPVLKYLNRLSDLLFVISRTLARVAGTGEVFWKKQ